MRAGPGGTTRVAAVLGWPVSHSRSPALHNAAFAAAGLDGIYVALPVRPGELATALAGVRALGLVGVNVTVPHKEAALGLCDRVEPRAARAGAVNTIVVRPDGLEGHNTDIDGLADALREDLPDVLAGHGHAVVLGAGGAARASVLALSELGFVAHIVARRPDAGAPLAALGAVEILPWTAEALAQVLGGARLVIDATSSGLDEAGEAAVPAPVPVERLPGSAVVCSLVYHREPALLARARASGRRVVDGGGMLVHQAARAFELHHGVPASVAAMRSALR